MIDQNEYMQAPTYNEEQAAYIEARLLELAELETLMGLRPLEEPGQQPTYGKTEVEVGD